MTGPWNLLWRGFLNQIKRWPQPLDSYLCTVFSSNVFASGKDFIRLFKRKSLGSAPMLYPCIRSDPNTLVKTGLGLWPLTSGEPCSIKWFCHWRRSSYRAFHRTLEEIVDREKLLCSSTYVHCGGNEKTDRRHDRGSGPNYGLMADVTS